MALRFARKWARATSESIATSEKYNRQLLQVSHSSGVQFALFLRGFEEEGKSIKSFFDMSFSASRLVKATRWIEFEIVNEFERLNKRVFCIANPFDTFLLPGVFRLEAKREDWLSEVNALATESEIVVIYVSAISQGLLSELNLLRYQNLMNKCVLILQRKILHQDASLVKDFPIVIIAPSLSRFNQLAFVPRMGRSRFRSDLRGGIKKTINAYT